MTSDEAFGDGGQLLLDNSAWSRSGHPTVTNQFEAAVKADQILISQPFVSEVLYSAKTGSDCEQILSELENGFQTITPDADTWGLALAAQRELAQYKNVYQRRFSLTDLMIASLAHQYNIGVLHQDSDFDDILKHSDLQYVSQWLDPTRAIDETPNPDKTASAARKTFNLSAGLLPADARIALWQEGTENANLKLAELKIGIPEPIQPQG